MSVIYVLFRCALVGGLRMSFDLEDVARVLEDAARGIRVCRGVLERVLGSSTYEVRETLAAMEGLCPADIREACLRYREARGGG